MKNPLWKRLPRELKSDFGKYIVIFLFLTLTIGFVSGFLVADDSMLAAYDEGFEKYNIEHGNFTFSSKASENDLKKIEKNGKVRICENFYRDEPVDSDLDGNEEGTMRIYQDRTDMNLVCLMSGAMPSAKNEIAIDRMYADNNKLKVGDKLKIAGEELTVTGFVALPDYSCLFSDNSDMMFDAVKFGVGIMTEEGTDVFGTTHLEYRYSWQYETAPKDDIEAKNMSEDFLEVLVKYGNVTGFIPAYSNQAITFTGEDMGGDKAMMEVLLYILIVIIAFVFAVTTNNTITKEASVIGTLRASGYTRKELLLHYISMPVIVTVVASVLGNVLGYTSFKDLCAGMYYGSYSLPTATPMGKGLGASPGAACGKIVFTADDAVEWAARGEKVVLVRLETSPEDITGMKSAQGILTVRGGMTSHAAVVARGMGECCVSGCGDIAMDEENKKFTLAGKEFHEGDFISIDGTTGNIYDGIIPTVDATIAGEFGRIMAWADKYRTMKVRTNADTPADAKKAVELGAEGIGLCRTEHMFFGEGRIDAFREMICSTTAEEREAALAKVLPYQQEDFEGLFEALEGNPVTIRFLDPPLHEFVPTEEDDIKKLADAQGKTVEEIKTIINSLHEFNPMMGHRGCRLAVTYPEIAKMQTTAVIRAAINVKKAHADWNICPEIMIPLVGDIKELKYVKKFVVETADAEIAAAGVDLKYEVGTMIEIPRAALTADQIASEADFFCFGTNDLTQMTYGFSRDDAGKFLNAYYDAKIFENDPFAKLDQTGVGKLMEMAIKLGKATRPELHVGICGEHGGDPSSVEFCHKIGLDYVSCSPFRVPIARLAAAQAALAD